MELTESEREAQQIIFKQIEDSLALIMGSLTKIGGSSGFIHISHIQKAHEAFLNGFKKGMQ